MIYFKQARLHPARAELEMALVIDESLAKATYGLGLIEARQGDMAAAANHFAHAAELRPNYGEALMNLGVARMRLGQIQQAIEAYLQVTELGPDNTRAHMYLSDAYSKIGDPQSSAEHRARAHQLEEGS